MLSRFVSCFVTENAAVWCCGLQLQWTHMVNCTLLCRRKHCCLTQCTASRLRQWSSILTSTTWTSLCCLPTWWPFCRNCHPLRSAKTNRHPPAISADMKLVSVSLLLAMSNCLVDCCMARKKKHICWSLEYWSVQSSFSLQLLTLYLGGSLWSVTRWLSTWDPLRSFRSKCHGESNC